MKWKTTVATIAALTSLAGSAFALTPARDVTGRLIPQGDGRPTVVLYVNKDNKAQLRDVALPMAYALRKQNPRMVVHVDLSDVPGLFKGFAKGEIQKGQRNAVSAMQKLYRQHGERPPRGLANSVYMVADSDGAPHRALGLEEHFKQPFAQVLGRHGEPLASGSLPAAVPAVERAIQTQVHKLGKL
ncbi:MAG: hypothetical protein JST54_32865 [Deltaproteobacteria bacterium]|nr:hypothetical protein [Deltaproteobacteria bacterium]